MLLAFSVAPITGVDESGSVSEAVARAVAVVRASGLPHETTSMFTTIEGEWDEVMAVVKAATDAVLEVSPRAGLVIKADVRPGFSGEMQGKLDRLEAAIQKAQQ
ncbi:MAG: thiamine-binding protein [Buchananella hordeovulneris]|nr:thiamine-binding protein [Buchananella hordeovulneris]